MSSSMRYLFIALALLVAAGCETAKPTTQPSSVRDRQEAALRDPFGYGGNTDKVDITGGDLGTFDKKAFGKDVDSVLSP